jgi:hypothetical protein
MYFTIKQDPIISLSYDFVTPRVFSDCRIFSDGCQKIDRKNPKTHQSKHLQQTIQTVQLNFHSGAHKTNRCRNNKSSKNKIYSNQNDL